MAAPPGRRAELAASLQALRDRIAAACANAGRNPADVTVIAVTKTFPAADVALLSALGVTDVGENRDQEAAAKAAECAAAGLRPRWHFVGQLQVNKAASVVRYATVVHSVDRLRLVSALSARASAVGRTVTCLIQVNIDNTDISSEEGHATPDGAGTSGGAGSRGGAAGPGAGAGLSTGFPGRGGAPLAQLPALAAAVAAADGLLLGGVMAVAPPAAPAFPAYERLAAAAAQLRREHPDAWMMSAGMSGDLEEAIAAGATHVRVGTALLGGRRAFVR